MPAGVSAWTPLANLTLGSSATTVTFSSISSSYRDLVLVVVGGSSSYSTFEIKFNGSSTSYTWAGMETNGGSSAYVPSGASTALVGNYNYWVEDIGTSNTTYQLQLFDYAQTSKHKSALYRVSAAATGVGNYFGRWANTSAVSSISVARAAGNTWRNGTTFALYGVSA